ncbi:MAG: hypothetical protein LBK41_01780 [Clostridiales bacterium]|nr:hypothetical protein [Clostridiales bacterium]
MTERRSREEAYRIDPGYPARDGKLTRDSKYDVEFSAVEIPDDLPQDVRARSSHFRAVETAEGVCGAEGASMEKDEEIRD